MFQFNAILVRLIHELLDYFNLTYVGTASDVNFSEKKKTKWIKSGYREGCKKIYTTLSIFRHAIKVNIAMVPV